MKKKKEESKSRFSSFSFGFLKKHRTADDLAFDEFSTPKRELPSGPLYELGYMPVTGRKRTANEIAFYEPYLTPTKKPKYQ